MNCTECDIFQAPNKPEIAQRIADWFKQEKGIEVKPADIRCLGCKGDRTKHWPEDCWILKCCVDDKGLEIRCQCGNLIGVDERKFIKMKPRSFTRSGSYLRK